MPDPDNRCNGRTVFPTAAAAQAEARRVCGEVETCPACAGAHVKTIPVVWPIVCATGHRPQHLSSPARSFTRDKLLRAAQWLRDERGTTVGLSGFALGTDLWWADAVVRAGLTLGAYIPCSDQTARWTGGDRREWERLRALADPAHSYECDQPYNGLDDQRHTGPELMNQRNTKMITAADAVLCVWITGKHSGGTWDAINTAHQLNRPGVHLDPSQHLDPARAVRLGLPPARRQP